MLFYMKLYHEFIGKVFQIFWFPTNNRIDFFKRNLEQNLPFKNDMQHVYN